MTKRLASIPVTFEDVVVYFTTTKWAQLTNWQRDFYQAVMVETYELVASLAGGGVPVAEGEEGGEERPVWQDIPQGKRRRKTPQTRADTAARRSKSAASKVNPGCLPRMMSKVKLPKRPECDKTFLPFSQGDPLPAPTIAGHLRGPNISPSLRGATNGGGASARSETIPQLACLKGATVEKQGIEPSSVNSRQQIPKPHCSIG
ncbi:zinc finger protein 2-like [Pseudonaja textilis]|uniref:zinc finger protein 2-like n=1 Tax=Pseudonaja textilis TaxID=8673 RepID=UPI000EA94313|nr:zinc finger protein 2-like [Pseudonaja textilis]